WSSDVCSSDLDILDAQPLPQAVHVTARSEPRQLGTPHGRPVGCSGNVAQHFVVRAAFLDNEHDAPYAGGQRLRGGGARLEAVRSQDERSLRQEFLRLGDWEHRKGALAPLAAAER